MTTITRPAYRVLGTTDEITVCGLCGRDELKGTVVLAVLDADGNETDVVHFGASCGAKAAGWTTKVVRDTAKAADKARRDAEQAARWAASAAWGARRDAWIATHIGRDALNHPRKYGFTGPVAVVRAYIEATGDKAP